MSIRIHQMLAGAAPGDAVTDQAFQWRNALDEAGVNSDIYAEYVDPRLFGNVLPLYMLPDDNAGMLLRYSIWSRANWLAASRPGPLGIIYHNITPARFMRGSNPVVAELCSRGRRELDQFASRPGVVIADSTYNAEELLAAGWPQPVIIPLLQRLPMPPPVRNPVPPTLLYVGRIAPNKRIEDLILILAHVREHHIGDARLDLIGNWLEFPIYREALDDLAQRRGVTDAVTFHGHVSNEIRDRAYEEAGVYVSMSEHEGFCNPPLEAMSRGLPVVVRDAGAVGETTGNAALLVRHRDIPVAAGAVARALTDVRVRRGLAVNARHRLEEITPEALTPIIMQTIAPLHT